MTTSTFDVMAALESAGAVLLDRHFVYKSHKHGSGYINMDPLFTDIDLLWQIGNGLWSPFADAGIQTIVGPATGGIALAYATAFSARQWILGACVSMADVAWADKAGDDFAFERAGFPEVVSDRRVLVVEDLLTTGKSVRQVIRQIQALGGEVIGVSAVCNRGGVTAADLDAPRLESMAAVSFQAIDPTDCPLCRDEVPIVSDIGHGDTYQRDHPDYPGGYVNLLTQ